MYFEWKPYVSVAARRAKAASKIAKLKKKGHTLSPVSAAGRGAIAKSFWGKAWCANLERYGDYANRLPRGRSYLRNGSVIDLGIAAGEVSAQVMGSSLYRVKVTVTAVASAHWQEIARDCARSIDTLVELLQGQLSTSVMERITRPTVGLFPSPKEIKFSCSCPDSAAMCKHIAATLYGIGARLDADPALLFALRNVDAKELIAQAGEGGAVVAKKPRAGRILDSSTLADVFGIEVANAESDPVRAAVAKPAVKRKSTAGLRKGKLVVSARKKTTRKKSK